MGTAPLTLVQAASLQSATSIDNEHVGRHSGGPAAAIELNTKPIRWGRGGRGTPISSGGAVSESSRWIRSQEPGLQLGAEAAETT
jgi:hypothetical protein